MGIGMWLFDCREQWLFVALSLSVCGSICEFLWQCP